MLCASITHALSPAGLEFCKGYFRTFVVMCCHLWGVLSYCREEPCLTQILCYAERKTEAQKGIWQGLGKGHSKSRAGLGLESFVKGGKHWASSEMFSQVEQERAGGGDNYG